MTIKPPVAVKIARTKLVEQLTFHQQTISKGLCTPYGVKRAEQDIRRLQAAIARADQVLTKKR
jgi:hypothetical protein